MFRLYSLGRGRRYGSLLAALVALGCSAQRRVEQAFAIDFQCPEPVEVQPIVKGGYWAQGCGKEATYDCNAEGCNVSTIEGRATQASTPVAIPTEDREPSLSSDIRVVNTRGKALLMLDLRLDRSSFLRLSAAPDKSADLVQLKLIRRDTTSDPDRCNFDWMLNNQRVKMPKPVTARDSLLMSQRIQVGPAVIEELANAEKIAFRSCDERYALMGYQVLLVREFVERLRQENAWKTKPRAGGSGGMAAPSGGWPAWQAAPNPPVTLGGAALDPRELFKKLSASVFQVEATRAHGTAQGSAVAVNESELLTNCHVIQGAQRLVLRQEKAEWAARIARADPKTDRCVLVALEAKLSPISGIRNYDSLEVGEPLYTLGSPVGLELTLSNGILSGRRTEGNRNFVQTTAPISPGSSGGGLFDARGNLVGITTLAIVGRERLNQALNFAIPADSFWQP